MIARGFIDEAADGGRLMERARVIAQHPAAIPATTFGMTRRAFIAPILERLARADDGEAIKH